MKRRDKRLGEALDQMHVPDHAPDFFARLDEALDEVDETERSLQAVPADAPTHERNRELMPRSPRSAGHARAIRRPNVAAAFAAIAAVAAVAYAILTLYPAPLPDRIAEIVGPQTATAAEITEQVRQALTGATSLRGVLVIAEKSSPDAAASEMRWDFSATAGGDIRMSGTNTMGDGSILVDDLAYDAAAGTERRYSDDSVFPMATERTGLAPGAPDEYVGEWILQRRLGSLVRAMLAAPDADVTEAMYEERPAWVLEIAVEPNLIADYSADHLEVTVDQDTGFPVRVVSTYQGSLVQEMRLESLEIDPLLPAETFDLTFPPGIEVSSIDMGFRNVDPEAASAVVGYDPVLPGWLPNGYEFSTMAVAEEAQSTGKEGMNPLSRGVVSMVYRRGFDRFTITTRLTGADRASWSDPLSGGEGFIGRPEDITLESGAFAGARAERVVDAHSVPHLWALGDELVLTVSGDLTAEEIVRIAESLQPLE